MSLVATMLIGIGILLVYSAVKNKNPADVVKQALRGKASSSPLAIPLAPIGVTQVSDPLLISGKWTLPVTGYTITARFGDRGSRWSSGFHTGLDFAVPVGRPVYAVGDGIIAGAAYSAVWGNRIVERLSDGTVLFYAHLSSMGVSIGRRVTAGMVIGRSGQTGNATGPHLHFEVRRNGVAIDPEPWLAKKGLRV